MAVQYIMKNLDQLSSRPTWISSCRKIMVTVSIANGADVVSASKKLGYATPSITFDIYSYANQEAQLRANKMLEIALYKNA